VSNSWIGDTIDGFGLPRSAGHEGRETVFPQHSVFLLFRIVAPLPEKRFATYRLQTSEYWLCILLCHHHRGTSSAISLIVRRLILSLDNLATKPKNETGFSRLGGGRDRRIRTFR